MVMSMERHVIAEATDLAAAVMQHLKEPEVNRDRRHCRSFNAESAVSALFFPCIWVHFLCLFIVGKPL